MAPRSEIDVIRGADHEVLAAELVARIKGRAGRS